MQGLEPSHIGRRTSIPEGYQLNSRRIGHQFERRVQIVGSVVNSPFSDVHRAPPPASAMSQLVAGGFMQEVPILLTRQSSQLIGAITSLNFLAVTPHYAAIAPVSRESFFSTCLATN